MSLPKIDAPIFETILPSTGEKVHFRPFTVKEEKILLIAKEAADEEQNILAMKQILNNCVLDKNIDDMAAFDAEYLLVAMRSKSVNNIVEFTIEDPDTHEEVSLKLDLSNVKIQQDPLHSKIIPLNKDYKMYMKYPNFDMFLSFFRDENLDNPLMYYDTMVSCIDKVVSEETVYSFADFSKEEIDKFFKENDM